MVTNPNITPLWDPTAAVNSGQQLTAYHHASAGLGVVAMPPVLQRSPHVGQAQARGSVLQKALRETHTVCVCVVML